MFLCTTINYLTTNKEHTAATLYHRTAAHKFRRQTHILLEPRKTEDATAVLLG